MANALSLASIAKFRLFDTILHIVQISNGGDMSWRLHLMVTIIKKLTQEHERIGFALINSVELTS